MKQRFAVLPVLLGLVLAACGSDSSLPQATGKGSIRAINAISAAPEVAFLIEERSLGAIDFRQASDLAEYDDLIYNFNFEVFFAGNTSLTRIATRNLDVIADTDYIMVLTGTLANASVQLWESPQRPFSGTETVFEARFGHTADALGSVDYYFAPPGTAPVLGEEVGTLDFGEVLTATDFEAGDYVLTVTTSGDPSDVLFESITSSYRAATQYTITTFDGGPGTFAPIIGRAYPIGANVVTLADANYPATVEFVNGSLDLGTVDIYDDDMQSSLIVDDLAHKEISAELNIVAGDIDIAFTPFDMNNPILLEQTLNFFTGIRGRVITVGETDTLRAVAYNPDRRGVDTHVKLQVFNASSNFTSVTVFAIDADAVLDDQAPVLGMLPSGALSAPLQLRAGSYDFYIRDFLGTENLAGPIRVDVALGDVVNAIVYDNVDPAIVDFEVLPDNP
jgi:hypothetical protein